jgi:hypothetical protein
MSDPPESFELPLECDSDFVTQKCTFTKSARAKTNAALIFISDALPRALLSVAAPTDVLNQP